MVQSFKRYLLAGGTHTLTLLLKPNSRLGVEAGTMIVLAGTAFWRVDYVHFGYSIEHSISNGQTSCDWQTSGLEDSCNVSCR